MYYRIYSTESFFVDIIQLRKVKIVFTQPDHTADPFITEKSTTKQSTKDTKGDVIVCPYIGG
jgi:predicted RNA-binding protein with PIN domain